MAVNSSTPKRWRLPSTEFVFDREPAIMGILNITPDSFSDGGQWYSVERAVEHGLALIEDGADILDIGGESTRPYSQPVPAVEQIDRVVPAIRELSRRTKKPISIDTTSAEVARAAIQAGAELVNDVSGGLADPEMPAVVRDTGVAFCVMHCQGTPQTMQDNPTYVDVVADIHHFLSQRFEALTQFGIPAERICLDPGIGFGKTSEHNWALLKAIQEFQSLPAPILVGHSRKGFITKYLDQAHLGMGLNRSGGTSDRDAGTLGISIFLAESGVQVLRVHDVRRTRDALTTWARLHFPKV